MRLSQQYARLRGVSIINQANGACGIYFGRQPIGVPDLPVPAGTFFGVPLAGFEYISYAFSSPVGVPPGGQTYIHITTDLVVSAAGIAATNNAASGVWDSSLWDVATWS